VRGRLLVIALALAAVVIALAASGDDERGGEGNRASTSPEAPADAIHLEFPYSPEKEELLAPLVTRFNAERHESGGRQIVVDARVMASGEAETKIADGSLKPAIWSPASSFWGRLLNYEADQRLVPDESPSIVRTPLVIAMWEELADAYGYPERPLGYRELGRLATGGWAAVGKPEFGPFKYVHTNPDFSTSGLSAVAASYYAAAGKREGLTEADVARARRAVRELERSIVHYGDTTLFISTKLREEGLAYASAVAMEETTLVEFNSKSDPGARLVAIYPEEGTFISDNPLITLHGEWVSAEQRAAAKVFSAFVGDAITPEVAGAEGFRPADEDAQPAGLVAAANGADPAQPERVLSLPEPRVLARIKAAWRADRKPANVMMVFDGSASMSEENKIVHARDGLVAFFRTAAPQDRMGLMRFSTDITPLVPLAGVRRNRAKLIEATRTILPDGDTRLRDAIAAGVAAVEKRLDPDAINAVVVLTDGKDTVSSLTTLGLLNELEAQAEKESGGQIRVFTIAYGTAPNKRELQRYAEASGGNDYVASTDDIASIYQQISSFF
jgi:Ca-activated chloride channel family protein